MSTGLIIFCYCIVVYGISNIVVYGSGPFRIFEHIRNIAINIGTHFGSLFSCMMCFPTNLGILLSAINWFFIPIAFTPFNIMFNDYYDLWWLAIICDGAFTSGIVWLIHHIEEFFETISEGQKISDLSHDNDKDDTLYGVEDITRKKA